jgi:uroporphyrinogen-III synthase
MGVALTKCVVYRTVLLDCTAEQWQSASVNLRGILFASPSAIEALRRQAPSEWWDAARKSLMVVVPGMTTREAAFCAGFQHVVVAADPSSNSMAAAALSGSDEFVC